MTELIGIVAATRDGIIGHNGGIPWHIPEDLAHFRKVTMGQTVIMGRKTYESLPKPLDGREVIVIGRGYHTLDEAMDKALARDVVYIAGGKKIYELFRPFISAWYWTEVDDQHGVFADCDTRLGFRPSEANQWRRVCINSDQAAAWYVSGPGGKIFYDG